MTAVMNVTVPRVGICVRSCQSQCNVSFKHSMVVRMYLVNSVLFEDIHDVVVCT